MSTPVGKYELISLLGRGGMGEVWRARDVELDRVVALKLLQRTSQEDLARFRREAHAVARLNHPNIAQLYEFGGEPPHLAMQFVEGEPISKPEHLASAARAVHYAHEQGILHRDLKPANILVDAAGRAFVLDFGLAREVKGDVTAMSVTGDVLGTPSYMAPEQARGDVAHLDARTDVYGLGATLYALLEGRPPHTGPAAYEVIRKVMEEDPPAPEGELGVIAMKAIDKDPARRYTSAAEFADDVDRHFRNEPIRARPASIAYRLRKQVQRRPAVWGLATTLTVAVLGGASFGVYQLARVAHERGQRVDTQERLLTQQREATERERLLRVLEATSRRIRELEDEQARHIEGDELQAVYGEAESVVRTLSAELDSHPEEGMALHFLKGEALRLEAREEESIAAYAAAMASPETEWARGAQAAARSAIGRARANLGRAMDLLVAGEERVERQREEAEAILPAVQADLDHAERGLALPARLRRLVALTGAYVRREMTELEAGATEEIARGGRNEDFYLLRGFARQGDAAISDFGAAIDRNGGLFRAWFQRGSARLTHGDAAGAIGDFDRAIELNPRYVGAYYNRAYARNSQGDAAGALADYDRAIGLNPQLIEAYAGRSTVRLGQGDAAGALADSGRAVALDPRYAWGYYTRGNARGAQGDVAGGLADIDHAIELNPRFAAAYVCRGGVRRSQGDAAGALADYELAIEVDSGLKEAYLGRGAMRLDGGDAAGALADFDRAVELDPRYVMAHYNRGLARAALGDFAGAIADYDRTIELEPGNAEAYIHRGNARGHQGDEPGAIADYDRATELDPRNAIAHYYRGLSRGRLGDTAGELADYGEAIRLNPQVANAWYNRGVVRGLQGDRAGAIADYDEAIRVDPRLKEAWYNRGVARYDQGDLAGAIADYDRAIELDPAWPFPYNSRGNARRAQGDPAGAMADYDRAIELNPEFVEARRNRGDARRERGDPSGAIADFDEVLRIDPQNAPALNGRGLARTDTGDIAGALADFDRAIELEPAYAEAYANRGRARLQAGDPAGDAADLRRALEVAAPDWPSRASVEGWLRDVERRLAEQNPEH